MSYDLAVFEPAIAPKQPAAFLKWFDDQIDWVEGRNYDDPGITSSRLRAWFFDMIKLFPAMNGPYGTEDDGNPRNTGYSITSDLIFVDFRWSEAEAAYAEVKRLADLHKVGFLMPAAIPKLRSRLIRFAHEPKPKLRIVDEWLPRRSVHSYLHVWHVSRNRTGPPTCLAGKR